MLPSDVKDAYLRQLGFIRLASYRSWDYPLNTAEAAFTPIVDVRYQHEQQAPDGAYLYAYSWVQEPGYLLSTEQHIAQMGQLVAELETDDFANLQQAVEAFFRKRGGVVSLPHATTANHDCAY
ncbi:hypothetical protein GCM10027346_15670 [Hymenobacter seoulensis]